MKRAKAFTLIEILIVVVLLAVLATIVVPSITKSTISAKETALKSDLALLRRFVPVYKGQHREILPGYPDGDTTAAPTEDAFRDQALLSTNESGQTAARGTPGFKYGPYLSKIPTNAFNRLDTIEVVAPGQPLPGAGDNSHGWIYKADTGEVRADTPGTDETGADYYAY